MFANKRLTREQEKWDEDKTDFISKHKAKHVHKRSESKILQPLITISLIVSHAEANFSQSILFLLF